MFPHASHCSKEGLKNIIIFTVDSDVILAHFFDTLSLDTLWIRFGVVKNVKFVACHEIAGSLSPDFSKGLTFFHAWTGVDTVSSFERHGKQTAWNTWISMSEAGVVFVKLLKPNVTISPDDMKILESFVIKWYCT